MKSKLLVLLIAGTLSIVIATTTTTFTNLFASQIRLNKFWIRLEELINIVVTFQKLHKKSQVILCSASWWRAATGINKVTVSH